MSMNVTDLGHGHGNGHDNDHCNCKERRNDNDGDVTSRTLRGNDVSKFLSSRHVSMTITLFLLYEINVFSYSIKTIILYSQILFGKTPHSKM